MMRTNGHRTRLQGGLKRLADRLTRCKKNWCRSRTSRTRFPRRLSICGRLDAPPMIPAGWRGVKTTDERDTTGRTYIASEDTEGCSHYGRAGMRTIRAPYNVELYAPHARKPQQNQDFRCARPWAPMSATGPFS